MKILQKAVILSLLALSSALIALPVRTAEAVPTPDTVSLNAAPLKEMMFTDHDGREFKLGGLHGQTVVLNFMFAGCSPVQTAALRRVYKDLQLDKRDDGVTFLSISVATQTDTPKQLKRFAEQFDIYSKNWRFAITDQLTLDSVLKRFDAGIPPANGEIGHLNTVFLINADGELTKRYQGYPVDPVELRTNLIPMIRAAQLNR